MDNANDVIDFRVGRSDGKINQRVFSQRFIDDESNTMSVEILCSSMRWANRPLRRTDTMIPSTSNRFFLRRSALAISGMRSPIRSTIQGESYKHCEGMRNYGQITTRNSRLKLLAEKSLTSPYYKFIYKAKNLNPTELQTWLDELRVEHRDLDVVIVHLQESRHHDLMRLQRLKRRKLKLKDMIIRLESGLIPDLDA
jgi:hypothetical protein